MTIQSVDIELSLKDISKLIYATVKSLTDFPTKLETIGVW